MSRQLTFSTLNFKKFSFNNPKKVLKLDAILSVYRIRFVTSLTNGRGSWVVGVGVGVGVGEELIMITHMKLIATFALCRIVLRPHPVKSPKN